MIGISASVAACLCCCFFLNACANVHCVNACVCFEANKYSSSSSSNHLQHTVYEAESQVGNICGWPGEKYTHTHSFNGPLSGTTRVSRYQKGKTNLDFTEARDSEWQWNPLGHMQVCSPNR